MKNVRGAWMVLGAAALFCAGAAVWRLSRPGPSVPPPAPPVPAPAAAPPASADPGRVAKSPEGRTALRIGAILSEDRVKAEQIRGSGAPPTAVQKEESASREREAGQLAAELVESLRRAPQSWPEVIDLALETPDLKVALRIAALVGPALDVSSEGLWTDRMSRSPSQRDRQIAAAALANGKTRQSLAALESVCDQDADPAARMSAMSSLAQRRLGAPPEATASIDAAIRRRADSDADEFIRRAARALITPASGARK